MKAVITVIGKDRVGILAKVAEAVAKEGANIMDVDQTVMDTYFTMTMLVSLAEENPDFDRLQESVVASVPDMQVHVMHEDIFNSMHRI